MESFEYSFRHKSIPSINIKNEKKNKHEAGYKSCILSLKHKFFYLLFSQLSQEDFPAIVSLVSHDVSNTTANSETDDLTKQFSNLGHEKIENAQQVG